MAIESAHKSEGQFLPLKLGPLLPEIEYINFLPYMIDYKPISLFLLMLF